MGGGQYSFEGWSIPAHLDTTVNGIYTADITATKVTITGTGNEAVSGEDLVEVQTTVTGSGIETKVIH